MSYDELVELLHFVTDGLGEQNGRSNEVQENEKRKLKKKKNKKEKKAQFSNVNSMVEDNSEQQIGNREI